MFCIDQDVLAGGFADRGQGGYGFDRSDYMAGDRDRSEAHSVLFKSACCCFALPTPLPSPLPQKHSVYIAVPLCTTQHETSSDGRANIAFDS